MGSIVLTVYVDDIVILADNSHVITVRKEYLSIHFHMKNLGHFRYFLGIEVTCSPYSLSLSYPENLLIESGMLGLDQLMR